MSRTHGLASTYRSGRCRCDDCRHAHTERVLREQSARYERLAGDPTLAPHGVYTTYLNWRCRCSPCSQAWSVEIKARRAGVR